MLTVLFVHKLVLWLFAGLLGWAAISDALHLLIPNRVSFALLLLYPAQVLSVGIGVEAGYAVLVAAIFLAAGATLFYFDMLGGGDVKLMSAVALWAGPHFAIPFVVITTFAGGAMAVALMTPVGRLLPLYLTPVLGPEGQVLKMRRNMPYGVAIAMGGLYVALNLLKP